MNVRPPRGRFVARVIPLLLAAAPLAAQEPVPVPLGQNRTAAGLVQHPGADGSPSPARHQLVVLHRVGNDHAGPIDSTFTDAQGAYRFHYRTTGSPDAVYFASSNFAGIAYFTSPLETQNVASPDGDIMVFDTTSAGIALHLQGRHLVIAAPDATGLRHVAEVFDIGNDSTRTLVARDSVTPLWTTQLPAGAQHPTVSGGDIAAGAVEFVGTEVRLFAPVSPGIRQLAVSFDLLSTAFPLRVPMAPGVSVLEVLLAEESATPAMPGLAQQSSVSGQGQTFKRYLAQDVPAGATLRIDVGAAAGGSRTRFIAGLVFAMAILMALALIVATTRTPKSEPGANAPS